MARLIHLLAALVLLAVILIIFFAALLLLFMAYPFVKADLTGGSYHSQICAFGTYTPCVDLNGWLLTLTGFILMGAVTLMSKVLFAKLSSITS